MQETAYLVSMQLNNNLHQDIKIIKQKKTNPKYALTKLQIELLLCRLFTSF